MTAPAPTARRRFVAGSAIGAAAAFVFLAALLVLTAGHTDLLRHDLFGNFFDAQARGLLDGHWDVPASELSIEGFTIDGKTYTYFGIFPSLLRMPVLAVADSLYGRLTQFSMLGALLVLLAGLGALHWRIRELIRPGRPAGWFEPAVALVALSCASTVVFLASRSIVYHEAILWGIAWSLVAYDRILALIAHLSVRNLLLASLCATLAFVSRASVGLGPVIALGLVVAGQVLGALRPHVTGAIRRGLDRLGWLGVGERAPTTRARWLAVCLMGAVVPVLAYTYVNYSRFESPAGIPWKSSAFVALSEQNRRVLAENGNTYFGLQFAPTTALQYLRPDALATNALFPWVTFPRTPAPIVGDVELIERTVATSIPASMPAIVLCGALGIAAAISARFARGRGAAALRAPLIGSGLAVIPVITVAYVGNRYLGDFIPFLFVAGLAGFQVLLRRREEETTRRWATLLLATAGVLTAFAVWANFSLALLYQRLYVPALPSTRAGMLSLQYDVDAWFGGDPRSVVFVDSLPRTAATAGTTAVVGDCEALYWSDGSSWSGVEGRPASGRFRLRVTFPPKLGRAWQPLVSVGPAGDEIVVGVHAARGSAELGVGWTDPDGTLHFLPSGTFVDPAEAPDTDEIEVVIGGPYARAAASVNRRMVLDVPLPRNPPSEPFRIGRAATPGVEPRFAGHITLLAPQLDVCEKLLDRRPGA